MLRISVPGKQRTRRAFLHWQQRIGSDEYGEAYQYARAYFACSAKVLPFRSKSPGTREHLAGATRKPQKSRTLENIGCGDHVLHGAAILARGAGKFDKSQPLRGYRKQKTGNTEPAAPHRATHKLHSYLTTAGVVGMSASSRYTELPGCLTTAGAAGDAL